MCDDETERENEAYLREPRVGRRELNLGAGAALTMMLTGCGSTSTHASSPETAADPEPQPESSPSAPAEASEAEEAAALEIVSRMVTIQMDQGEAEAFFTAPKQGPRPGVLMWPDVAGLRDAYKRMAERLAREGYAVLAVNQYYRSTKLPVLETFAEWKTEAGKAKIGPMREAITADGIARDGAAFVAFLSEQPEVDQNKKVATSGYCMGGPFTFRTAAAVPERVGVIASFHGGGLVTDEPDSPHELFSKMKAAALICIAQNDHERDPEAKEVLREAAEKAGREAEIEVYPAQHGWCALDSPVYDEEQAERAWSRMLATFDQHL